MNSIIFIYIIGFFVTWYICKRFRGRYHNQWGDIGLTLIFSACSWIGLLIILLCFIYYIIPKDLFKDPPKWL